MDNSHMIKCSLIISTYNWPEALNLCLQSVLKQSILPSEIIIADDGSKDNTRQLIDNFRPQFTIPLIHVWQEDKGFRLSKIRNKAIAKSNYEYLIQIDGDVILNKHFIADHLKIAKRDNVIAGSRALLNKRISDYVLREKILPSDSFLKRNCEHKLNSIRIKALSNFLSNKYKVSGKNKHYVKGCNMAFWKKDIIEINGYNEKILGWGSEDQELLARLIKAGKKKLSLKMSGIVFHIWHKTASKQQEDKNIQILKDALLQSNYTCELGINQYL